MPITRRSALQGLAAGLSGCASVPRDPATETDVLVLGAGIAGLHAARLLQAAGVQVQVLEASGRVGGRCWTARHVPGRPEMGAVEIGPSYGRVRGTAAELGVALVPRAAGGPSQLVPGGTAISIGGRIVASRDWPQSPLNRLADSERALLPTQLFLRYLDHKKPLVELSDWLRPEFAEFDRLPLRDYFTAAGASPEALRLLEVTSTARDLGEANALDAMRKYHFYRWEARAGATHLVEGGMSTLTDAMAASLQRQALTNKPVRAIQVQQRRVTVHCQDGTRYGARSCISTIPLPVFSGIEVDAPVPERQREAWRSIPYGNVLLVVMGISAPYWEKDGLSPDLWTDGLLERVFHTRPAGQPHGQLLVFINGQGTEAFAGLPVATVAERVLRELVRLRPAMAGAVAPLHVHDWAAQPWNRGHLLSYAPGQIGRYEALLAQPVGALHFAGEHCARLFAGLEGACEAAENAVMRVLDELS